MADVAFNPGVPQVFSGPRALFKVGSTPIAYASNVSGEESVDYEPVDVLDLLEVMEHVPVSYRTSLSAQIFRVIGKSIKELGIFPKIQDIVTSSAMTATIEDAVPVSGTRKAMAFFMGVRCGGHSWDVTARGMTSDNVNFVAIRVQDETET
jgi:hypothetical protein